jgi:hypothetical protein
MLTEEIYTFLQGKRHINLSSLRESLNGTREAWSIVAVLVGKSETKARHNKGKYQIWKLSDLGKATVSLFLYSETLERVKELQLGSVLALSCPKVLGSTNVGGNDNSDDLL